MSLGRRLDPACLETRHALAVDPPEAAARARIEAHRGHCAACQAFGAQLEQVRQAVVLGAGPPLDELTRARIQSRLARDLDNLASERGRAERRWIAPLPLAAALALAAGIAVAFFFAAPRTATVDRSSAPATPVLAARIHPYVVAGRAAQGSLAWSRLGQGLERIEVPDGGLVRAALGERARITLIGPAELAVLPARAEHQLRIGLVHGLLLGQFEHGDGESLVVESGSLRAEVVGTVFGIDARVAGATPSVWVLEGEVAVSVADRTSFSVRRESASSSSVAIGRPLKADERALLGEHRAALLPPRSTEGAGTLVLSGRPEGAESSIGALAIGPTPFSALLTPGTAEVSVRAAGHRAVVLKTAIARGESTNLGFVLEPAAEAEAPKPAVAPPSSAPSERVSAQGRRDPSQRATPPSALPATPPPASAPDTADALYRRAEQQMRAGDKPAAQGLLAELARRFPDDLLADSATYELARLAFEAHDRSAAREHLAALLDHGRDPALREPARYLSCRLFLEAGLKQEDAACWASFRREFPGSAHDGEALLHLAEAAEAAGDCPTARAMFGEYLSRHPEGPSRKLAEERRAGCKSP